MGNFVYSTLPNAQSFAVWIEGPNGAHQATRHIHIQGGGQVPVLAGTGTFTPLAKRTEVSADDLTILQKDHSFKFFVDKGFFTIETKKVSAEKVASDMNIKVPAAPLSESDIEEIGENEGVDVKVFDEGKKRK